MAKLNVCGQNVIHSFIHSFVHFESDNVANKYMKKYRNSSIM